MRHNNEREENEKNRPKEKVKRIKRKTRMKITTGGKKARKQRRRGRRGRWRTRKEIRSTTCLPKNINYVDSKLTISLKYQLLVEECSQIVQSSVHNHANVVSIFKLYCISLNFLNNSY